jgi:hypothetical protein
LAAPKEIVLDPAWVPIISGLIGAAAVWIGGLINGCITYRRDEKRRVREEKQKCLEAQNFLDVFSRPMFGHIDSAISVEWSGTYLKAALDAIKFGDVRLSERVNLEEYAHSVYDIDAVNVFEAFNRNNVYEWEIQSLADIIKILLKLRYGKPSPNYDLDRFWEIKLIGKIGIEEFGSKFLEYLIEHQQSSESSTSVT